MKYRYIQIFSFLVALLSFSIFSACEVDDKIVFVQDKVNPPSQSEEMSFSVSESKQVCFSKGNLQYHPANNEWRFAESQLDYIGDANINISATYNGWLDLFGWSTSATNFGVSTSTNDNDYSGDFVDWGTNQIGSDAPNTWRTLSNDEWDYLLNTRTNADALRGVAQVNGVNGLVFLPDSWTCPEGITFKSGFSSKWSVTAYGQNQTFTAEQWSLLESAGAIFLPASGLRDGSDVRYVQNHGNYWSATEDDSYGPYYLNFVSDEAFMYFNCYDGFSVRLVKDLLPVVTTSTITQITETTAVAGGSVTSDGNASVTERGVCVATASNPTTSNTKITSGSGTGSFTCELTNLQPNTTYYVRAYATNSMGTAYGEEVSFTTNKNIVLPSVTTNAITQITETTAVAGGNVTSDGNASVTERGIVYSTNPDPVITNLYNTIKPCGSGTGSFTCDLTNLQPNTTYYVRAYAINSKGTAYGDEISFTTALPITLATVTTAAITQITETSAVAGGNVTSDGNASVTERGVVYSTNPNPVITNLYNTIKPCGSGTGSFTCDLTNLQPNTTYYVRAYATNSMGTAYGEEVSFTTKEESNTPSNGTENGYAYVDLGLSVKWATCNVGASQPEEYGDYFAWGETQPTDYYDWSTYKWCNGSHKTHTKYCTDSYFGTVDNKTTLEMSDDAAHANWGGSWRMPTKAEQDELYEQCTWTWTTQNGVNGYKVTSKKNGNSIFLPAAGFRNYSSSLQSAGSKGYYWSSMISPMNSLAYVLDFTSDSVSRADSGRCFGNSVRPVCP
ncbi:MAG: hypothetical protein IKB81_01320 [Paludibacteraceae bacterium]|nr:hypothetical protein [Paludibacteraceae bacterium]